MEPALLPLTADQADTLRIALLTLRDEFSIVAAEHAGQPGRVQDKRDREIAEWHAAHVETAEILLAKLREMRKDG